MDSNFTVLAPSAGKLMLCPCCGGDIALGIKACACGARFVGPPLDESPVKIQCFEPALTALLLLALAVALTAVFTKWLAPLAIVPAWFALRALRLEKRDPAGFGGRRIAAATLTLAVAFGAGMAAYGIAKIPRALDNHYTRRVAATEAKMWHVAGILEDYKRTYGAYPMNMQELVKVLNERMPEDYWEKAIRYQGHTEELADSGLRNGDPRFSPRGKVTIHYKSFELRSAGADGIEGTDDDIIMRDGIFFTNAELKKLRALPTSSDR